MEEHRETPSAPRKDPRDESNEEALMRFIRGSWYWALAAYVAVVTVRLLVSFPPIPWHDIYELTILTAGFYGFYLAVRMQFAGRVPHLPSDVYD